MFKQGSPEWHAFRQTGIGASNASVILGISPYMTPYQLYCEKLGLIPGQKDNAAMREEEI